MPLDDLLVLTREFTNPAVSRAGLNRCLVRHGVATLASLNPPVVHGEEIKPLKTFKDYEPGFVHVDIKYLPQMADETRRRYLFVAIDRATRWVYFRIYRNQSQVSSTDFLRRLARVAPMVIKTLLTDNGSQFTDRFTSIGKQASGEHVLDLACNELAIGHSLCPPRHPQINGMVERFNGRIDDLRCRRGLPVRQSSTRPSNFIWTPTTTAYRSVPWTIEVRFRHSKRGEKRNRNCLSNGFMNRRNLTNRQMLRLN